MPLTIRIRDNGPYFISAEDAPYVRLENAAGNVVEPTLGKGIALCRCGASSRKPFCDASHKQIGFTDSPGAPHAPAVQPGAEPPQG